MPRIGDIIGYARVQQSIEFWPLNETACSRKARYASMRTRTLSPERHSIAPACPHFSTTLGQKTHLLSFDLIDLDDRSKNCWKLETVEDLKAREINLISQEERIDTTSAAGELVFHIFGTITQFERRLISQRTNDGLTTARKHGEFNTKQSQPDPHIGTGSGRQATWI